MSERKQKDLEQPRGPSPADNPEGTPDCDPDPAKQLEPGTRECPDGYPDEERRDPQFPKKSDPAPNPPPTREGN